MLGSMRAALLFGWCLTFGAPLPSFRAYTVSKDLKMGYQLAAVDVNGDKRIDLIAVDERGTELAWFENPGWDRHVIAADVPRTINIDAADIDGDGVPEIAILYKFESRPDRSVGIVSLLKHDGDPRRPWKETKLDQVPTAHRVRWLDLDGKGSKVMIMAPMVGLKAEPPKYEATVPIYIYRPPAWKREVLSEELSGVLHSIYPVDWDARGGQELLTAGFNGLRLFRPSKDAGAPWRSEAIAAGIPEECPRCGSSEIVRGRLGKSWFLAAIEPWHGNQVTVYRKKGGSWQRLVIEDSFQNGHALAVGDLNGDGRDEIVAGFRGKGFQLYYYSAEDKNGSRWTRHVLDAGGIAAADCKIRDFNRDGVADVACSGASTGNIVFYEGVRK